MSFDVNLKKRLLTVNKKEKTKTYEIEYRCKDDSDRVVGLNDDAIAILEKVLEIRANDASESKYLFLSHNSDDDKLHLRALDNRLKKIQDDLGLTKDMPARSSHDCRRAYASIQYLNGVDIQTIQFQLGHESEQQTWDYIKDIVDINTRTQKLKKGCILGKK